MQENKKAMMSYLEITSNQFYDVFDKLCIFFSFPVLLRYNQQTKIEQDIKTKLYIYYTHTLYISYIINKYIYLRK